MAKLQGDLRESQAEIARVTMRNEKLEQEMGALRNKNEKLQRETNEGASTKSRTTDAANVSGASSIAGARVQSVPNGGTSTCEEPRDKNVLGCFSQPLNRSSNLDTPKLEHLPADIRNRTVEHTNNCECHLRGRKKI
jgi:hypothetical protein